jgi:hypothetical protein
MKKSILNKFSVQSLIVILLAFSITQSALADPLKGTMTGEVLLNSCNSSDRLKLGICYGAIAASDQMVQLLQVKGLIGRFYCTPQRYSSLGIVKVVKKYLENNPEKLNIPVSSSILFALVDKYPCPKKP